MVGRECNFCGTDIEPGTGMVYIRRDGAVINFCSKKCRVNMVKLKRVPRKTRWTREYHNLKSIKLASIEHAKVKQAQEVASKEPEEPLPEQSPENIPEETTQNKDDENVPDQAEGVEQ